MGINNPEQKARTPIFQRRISRRGFNSGVFNAAVGVTGIVIPGISSDESKDSPENSVEQAIKNERIEFHGERDEWMKYFIPVTAKEAQELFTAETKGFLFPLDPRIPSDLVVETETRDADGRKEKFVAVRGLLKGTVIYSPVEGPVRYNTPSQANEYIFTASVESIDKRTPVISRGAKPLPSRVNFELVAFGENVYVGAYDNSRLSIGNNVAIVSKGYTPMQRPENEPDLRFRFVKPDFYDHRNSQTSFNFLIKDGKIAFIKTPPVRIGRF